MTRVNSGILNYFKKLGCEEHRGTKKKRCRHSALSGVLIAVIALAGCVPAQTQGTTPTGKTDTSLAASASPSVTATKTVMPKLLPTSKPTGTTPPELKVTQIVSGEGHSCALLSDGKVKCWGKNEFGQLGDGTTENREAPVPVGGLKDVKALTAGWGHTCALTGQGAVMCWGYNKNGELGNDQNTHSSIPVTVWNLPAGVKAFSAGDDHTCALTGDGKVMCWGFNETGQLGDGTNYYRDIPVPVLGLKGRVDALAAGWGHTCALTEEGGVQCWGDNEDGQLGNGPKLMFSNSPMSVGELAKGVAAITAKGGHSCALLDAGSVKCWGDNSYGQLGDGTAVDRKTPETVIGLEGAVRAVAAGWNHTCVITEEGGMKCWGWNYFGQLGDRSMTLQLKPVTVVGLPGPAAAMGLGWRHSCAVIDPGLVICWGANEYGQGWDGWLVEPGFPAETPTAVPDREKTATRTAIPDGEKTATRTEAAATPGLSDFQYQPMDSGGNHNCAITKKGGVKCWGQNDSGQLGNESAFEWYLPVDVTGLTGEVAGVAVGGNHSCALMRSGEVMCWGANFSGEIGNGDHVDRKTPVMVIGLPAGATAVAAGGGHTCAVVPDGVMCWGANNNNQLGIDEAGRWFFTYPVRVDGLPSGMRALSAISDHTCGLTREGGAVCWGLNKSGQLGDGSDLPRSNPVPVAGLGSGVISIAAGGSHSCAVLAGGKVKCWGDNSSGQLGDGTLQSSPRPIDVLQGEDKAVRVVTGFYHTCYQTESGKVKCWGLNTSGQLGDQSYTSRTKPVEVKALEGVLFLEAGDMHTCAMLAGNSIKCWGSNLSNQLGSRAIYTSSVPVFVVWNE